MAIPSRNPELIIRPDHPGIARLHAEAATLPGVGPAVSKLLNRLGIHTAWDLLLHLPTGVIDRSYSPPFHTAEAGRFATFKVRVMQHERPKGRGRPYKVVCVNESGALRVVFFNSPLKWVQQALPVGEERVISGRLEQYQGLLQMSHPDIIAPLTQYEQVLKLHPIYALTQGLSSRQIATIINRALTWLPSLPEWQDEALLKRHQWPAWRDALHEAHHPGDELACEPNASARQRLAYDELLAYQLALALVRRQVKRSPAFSINATIPLRDTLERTLPFRLTQGQQQVLADIEGDLKSGYRMSRLVQGDVGSGKTVLALLAAASVIDTGRQAAVMAPTEILCQQHLETLQSLAGDRISILSFSGKDKGRIREQKLAAIAGGEAQLVIGTHALFQESVAFQNLGLAIVDEQHRFGVEQRLQFASKTSETHLLMLTATPIPRSISMMLYGDLDCSQLREKPPGRKPVQTRVLPMAREAEVIEGISRALAQGRQVYWVCPLVEESEAVDLTAAEDRYAALKVLFPGQVALAHGKMKPADRETAMQRFSSGAAGILVATTVIEVGVNVPNASIMIIEHAERFGLSQLHQLRGRVGRGSAESSCLLLYGNGVTESGIARLKIMRETEDGFRIAEEDLKLRGAGDVLGTRQSGLPVFRVADLEHHRHLLEIAHQEVKYLLHQDPDFTSPRGRNLTALLALYGYDKQIRYLTS